MNALFQWLDDRTGYRQLVHHALYESIPGGSRWRYVWGSTLVVTFITQVITGVFLWLAYSPSANTAWESVYYIQHHMQLGWLLRGIHHFTAHAMVVLLVLHLMQVVIDGAYRAPREVNFWIGLVLMLIVFGLSLTGYLLPWDQKGYWATRVATNLLGLVPGGDRMQQIVVGGPDYGHHTLTRFFALHAGVLPGLLIFFLVVHLSLFRRHGLCAKAPTRRPDTTFWPEQVFKDSVASLAVLAAVLVLAIKYHGAELGAPADPASPYSAARPEWYFLFLFQFLKYFSGSTEVLGAIVIPGLVMLMLFLMPIVGRWKLGHRFNVALVFALVIGAGLLTIQAKYDDTYAQWHKYDKSKFAGNDEARKKYEDRFDASESYLAAVEDAQREAERTVELASSPTRIPPLGALAMLRDDPKTQGPKLFRQHCAACHNYVDREANDASRDIVNEHPTAPNLYNFASRDWISGLLNPELVKSVHYFGYLDPENSEKKNSAHLDGDMVGWVADNVPDIDQEELANVVMALSAEAALPAQVEQDEKDAAAIEAGRQLIKEEIGCTDCHKFHDAGDLGMAPDLTGYGSREWLIEFISNPEHERFYPETNDRMPAFAKLMDRKTVGLVVDWLRGEWFRPEPPAPKQ